jgi:hypothetical protein
MTRQAQVALLLSKDLVEDGSGNPYSTESAHRQVSAVADEASHRIADGSHLVR